MDWKHKPDGVHLSPIFRWPLGIRSVDDATGYGSLGELVLPFADVMTVAEYDRMFLAELLVRWDPEDADAP